MAEKIPVFGCGKNIKKKKKKKNSVGKIFKETVIMLLLAEFSREKIEARNK